jgi:hypothetical protein
MSEHAISNKSDYESIQKRRTGRLQSQPPPSRGKNETLEDETFRHLVSMVMYLRKDNVVVRLVPAHSSGHPYSTVLFLKSKLSSHTDVCR